MFLPNRTYTAGPGRLRGEVDVFANDKTVTGETMEASSTHIVPTPRALSQKELHDAIREGVVDGFSRLGLMEKHTEVIEIMGKLQIPADLEAMTRCLSQLLSLRDGQAELLEAITNATVRPPDLSPLLEAISNLSDSWCSHKEMEGTTNIVVDPPDLSVMQRMLQDMKADITTTLDGFRREVQEDLGVLQQEVLRNRQETRSNLEALVEDVHAVPRELEELRKEMRRVASKELGQSEVLNAVRQIRIPDINAAEFADAVHDRLVKNRLKVDNSDVLQALQNLERDQPGLATLVADRVKKLPLSVDTTELLEAVSRLSDAEAISKCTIDKMKRLFPEREEFSELSDMVRKIKREPDMTPILSAIQELDLQLILDAVSRIKLDQSPVIDALQKIQCPDTEAIGRIVTDRLRKHNVATNDDCVEILGSLKRIPANSGTVTVDNREMLAALSELHGSLKRMPNNSGTVDNSEVLTALSSEVLTALSEILGRLKRMPDNSGTVDNSEVLTALSGIRLDMGSKSLDQWNIGHALGNMEREMRQLRETISALSACQRVVQGQTSTAIAQPVQRQCGTMRKMSSTPAILQPQTQVRMIETAVSPRASFAPGVVSEIYGTMVNPSVPVGSIQETVTMWPGYAQATVAPDALISPRQLSSGRTSPTEWRSPQETVQDELLSSQVSIGPAQHRHVGSYKGSRGPII